MPTKVPCFCLACMLLDAMDGQAVLAVASLLSGIHAPLVLLQLRRHFGDVVQVPGTRSSAVQMPVNGMSLFPGLYSWQCQPVLPAEPPFSSSSCKSACMPHSACVVFSRCLHM